MKYLREHYLAKHKRKHFGRINIGDLDKIISNMLKLAARSNLNVCVLHTWHIAPGYGS